MSGTLPLPTAVRLPAARQAMYSRQKWKILAFAPTVGARKRANLYEVLRIKETASQSEIKTAYRALAKRFHPDAGSDGRDFMEIHEAYATLSDPTARALYDSSIGAIRRSAFSAAGNPFQTRRWETDQCW